jgi:hypothetical protein
MNTPPFGIVLAVAFLAVISSACQQDLLTDSGAAQNGDLPATVPSTHPLGALRVIKPESASAGAFSTGLICARCHSNEPSSDAMRTAGGEEVSPYNQWRSTMMANASRDPLWRAVVSAEMSATPSRAAEIESKCMRCHAPMALTNQELTGAPAPTLASLQDEASADAQLALDGVSCTLCHQIQPNDLGQPASYSGHFTVTQGRQIFGPYPNPFGNPMKRDTDFSPVQGGHIQSSALCGSCHTLLTEAFTPEGEPTGDVFPEQTPYLEWRNSQFNDEVAAPGPDAQSCQSCHMPRLLNPDGSERSTRIARAPNGGSFGGASARSPYAEHLFVGGNTLIPAILRDNMDVFQPLAPRAAFDTTIARALDQLEHRTAEVAVTHIAVEGGTLSVDVRLNNLTGHRFPTGHPSRRAWVRLEVRDATGRVVFVSGGFDGRGRIVGEDGQPLPNEVAGGAFYPHAALIARPDQAHVLELVMGDANGALTHSLIRAAKPLQDNRLLPLGWRADHPDAPLTKPYGTDADLNFLPGDDTISYRVPLSADLQGPFTVDVSLLYQVLGARYAAELFAYDTPEVIALKRIYDALPDEALTPVTVAHAEAASPRP